jgi:hypothetical protein
MQFLKSSGLALVAAVAFLPGCMGGGTASTPSVSGMSAMHQTGQQQTQSIQREQAGLKPVLAHTDAVPDTSCSSEYTGGCYAVDAANPISFEWCVSSSGDCSSGLVGTWEWTSTTVVVKTGKTLKKSIGVWSPDPGNPSTITISTKNKNFAKKPKVVDGVYLSTCSSSIGCFSDFAAYGIAN